MVLVFFALVLLLSTKPHEASRNLREGKEEWMKQEKLLLQSLPQGPVPPSSSDPPTFIPARSNTVNTISQKGFAGHAIPSQHVNPQHIMRPLSLVVVFFALALLLSTKPHEASRILREGKEEWMKQENLLLQSLEQGPVPPLGPNPPTHIPPIQIPASSNKVNTISQKGFAGHAMPLPPFDVAKNEVM
ncbi:hypothetical protein Acr_13g0002580 [Actinidia rufa]|uniref:Uncharacterized protein n=1 Tax=Actinidia rufa TaxID=165716 RepID=A0A7J0FLQ2_9ERIC|nr:hypothetical protein Acr_13g0002580 [Actinidia rufa]